MVDETLNTSVYTSQISGPGNNFFIVINILSWTNQNDPTQAYFHLTEVLTDIGQRVVLGGDGPEGHCDSAHQALLIRVHLVNPAQPVVPLAHLPVILEHADVTRLEVGHLLLPLGEGEQRVEDLCIPHVPPQGQDLVNKLSTARIPVIALVELLSIEGTSGGPAKQQEVRHDGEHLIHSLVVVPDSQGTVINDAGTAS